jgi:septal ring factor EnvC (AmiA/AmiB activator)
MQEDEFTKLFKYMQHEFGQLNSKLDEKASQSTLSSLMNSIDGFIKRLDDNETEQSARDAQFDRLLDWARKVSKKTGIPLEGF